MRILLKLRAARDFNYDNKYFNKVQGFIYSLLKETEYCPLHDKQGYKFFCFSNIFPLGEGRVKKGERKNMLISSPDRFFIGFVEEKLRKIFERESPIKLGRMVFKVEGISLLKPRLRKACTLISATPIVVRIPRKNYERYGIKDNRSYVYWRKEHDFSAFVKQLEENLFKKYNEFYRSKVNEFPVFEQFRFKKQVCNHVVVRGKEIKIIGSVWEFTFSYLSEEQKRILEFGMDCGFGERNSLGFGFMNVLK